MSIQRKPTRYAHSEGHTDVCYSEDGKHLLTCGSDGDIRIWSGFDDDDPSQTCVGEWALCLCQKGKHLHVGTNTNIVQVMTYPDPERDGILIRFTAHVNHMATGRNHNLIAIVSEDMEVKVIDLSKPNESGNILSFHSLTGPPLSVALCPKGKLLAVASGDGFLRIWNVEDSLTILKEIECVPKTNSFMNAKLLCRIHFEPCAGKTLAYPNKNTVIITDTITWSEKLILACPKIQSSFSIVQFSPCGNFMAAATENGELVIWQIISQTITSITYHQKSIAICSMVWNPSGNGEIAFCDVQGQLGLAINCLNSGKQCSLTGKPVVINEESNCEVNFDGIEFVEDDEDNENAISLKKIKNDTMGSQSESELDFDKDSESSRAATPRARTPEIFLQKAFMPTSTPAHLNPRYFCWNEVGIVRSYGSDVENEEYGSKSIEVEFHDSAVHNGMMIQNFHDYTMGCLSTTVLMVSSSSFIGVIPLNTACKEWNINLSDNEEIVCIACSDRLVCFALANYLVRVYTVYGTQKTVLSVPGPVVAMSCYSHLLLIAYHSGAVRKGDQCINMMLVKLEGMSIESKDINSALRPATELQWLGFTDMATPAMQDSSGLLSLYPEMANIWLPFCDTSTNQANAEDKFFITAVFESFQAVRGVRCRNSSYPNFIPRPVLSELTLEPPFLESNMEKSQFESNLCTWSLLRVSDVEKKFKETALKSFVFSCRNNLDQRALELVEMLANQQLVTLATKYATKLNKRRLAERLIEIGASLQDSNDSNLDQTMYSTTAEPEKPLNRKLVLNSKRLAKSKVTNVQVDEKAQNNCKIKPADITPSTSGSKEDCNTTIVNTSDISIDMDVTLKPNKPTNPFAKNLKKTESATYNPISMIDKFAGYEAIEKKKEKQNKSILNNGPTEKRKKPDSDVEKSNEKQRKLDKFIFSKRS